MFCRCYENDGFAPEPGDVWIDAGAHIGLFTFRALALGADTSSFLRHLNAKHRMFTKTGPGQT